MTSHYPSVHGDILYCIAKAMGITRYLEIGVQNGACFQPILGACHEHFRCNPELPEPLVVAVDTKKKITVKGGLFFEKTSDDFFKEDAPNMGVEFDLIFIDGNHNPEFVFRDFRSAMLYVRDQGVIALHDTYPDTKDRTHPSECDEAYKVADWIVGYPGIESMTIPYSPGLTLIRKREQHLPWL